MVATNHPARASRMLRINYIRRIYLPLPRAITLKKKEFVYADAVVGERMRECVQRDPQYTAFEILIPSSLD